MANFTPWASLLGGILIGLSAAILMVFNGRVAGISGILGGVLMPGNRENDLGIGSWRGAFLAGLLAGGLVLLAVAPELFSMAGLAESGRGLGVLVVGGLLVGFGTRMGGGCTSGHGVCGLARLSKRSLAAVLTFMLMAAVTVFVFRMVMGGAA